MFNLQVNPETTETESAERKLPEKQASAEEDAAKRETLDR